MKILNYGSLNIDLVYRMPRIVAPGETLSSSSFETFAGGKGANQTTALAKAGAPVCHAGKVGRDGQWLVDKLQALGANVDFIRVVDQPSGHAVIQVDDRGENAIFLFPGTNHEIMEDEIEETLGACARGDILLLQNEINNIPYIIAKAHAAGLRVCLNPAPMDAQVANYPLDKVDILIVNGTEGAGLAGQTSPDRIMAALSETYPDCEIVLTLGAQGARACCAGEVFCVAAEKVKAVDTTGAGDTFIGYYLGERVAGRGVGDALRRACRAAAISVTRPGAADSIPTPEELDGAKGQP